ncbi:hypothetical protein [Collimonas pratensis]|uniref:hypothetical protein n=1 Tax=Collimonas pratensis TaxID=279113 RepID=UPI0012375529|nr:hypothetical protein [Collimonas pratensis]
MNKAKLAGCFLFGLVAALAGCTKKVENVSTDKVLKNNVIEVHPKTVRKDSDIDSCVRNWIAAYRREKESDDPINADQIEEWKKACEEGENP